ncbi:efflux transporter outer membrane subunit [Sphingobium sp. H39-3-25]|uniref:efflux transporter outer membrane subunit n=1 Tax=Sphingobium arseniciresistens TaxID=3030834 RepID=UPI0023B8FF8B|nr:efflux transporter outer membrane subunit [Sphingobium arseniciresistens]
MSRSAFIAPLMASCLLVAGCDMAPKYVRPIAPVPASMPVGGAYAPLPAEAIAGLPWREVISDAHLVTIIDRALANNRDLRVALANVASARAQYRVERAAQLPTVALGGDASFVRKGDDSYSADLGISAFEIDLFGRVKNLSKAALETYLATEEGMRATRITLIAETASAYATLAADQDLLQVAQDTAASAQRSLDLTRQLNGAGLSGKLDVHQAETVLAQAQSDVEANMTQVAQDRNALDLLVGAPVEAALLPTSLDALTQGMGTVPAGLSSSVLLERPDVLQAEHQLKAANADIGAARAAFFPRISLTAAAGFASSALSSLFTGGAFAASATPSATMPVLGGTNPGNLAYAKAQRDLYLAQYEKTVQTAFQEVADALARAGTIGRQQAAQDALVTASGKSFDLADQRYRAGIDTFLNRLVSQRTLYNARQSAIAVDLAAVTNRLTLYRVIGNDGSAQ